MPLFWLLSCKGTASSFRLSVVPSLCVAWRKSRRPNWANITRHTAHLIMNHHDKSDMTFRQDSHIFKEKACLRKDGQSAVWSCFTEAGKKACGFEVCALTSHKEEANQQRSNAPLQHYMLYTRYMLDSSCSSIHSIRISCIYTTTITIIGFL